MTETPLVYSVVLNWNRADLTIACLRSIAAISYPRHRIIVVDNGSSDDSVARIRAAFPAVDVIENGANHGFGAGINVGIRAALCAGADFVWELNNDLECDAGTLTTLLAAAEANPGPGVLTPKILRGDGSDLIWYAGGSYNRRLAQVKRFGAGEPDSAWPRASSEVSFAPACSLLLRRELLEAVGLFDETYFLYWDDVEFCDRVRRAGQRILYVPEARVRHSIGGSGDEPGGNSALFDYYNTRNLFWFLRQRSRGLDRVIAETFNLAYLASRAGSVLFREERKRDKLTALAKGLRDGHFVATPAAEPPRAPPRPAGARSRLGA